MITITDVSNDTQLYWEIVDTTSNQPPEKIVYYNSADRDRALRQLVEQRKAGGYIDTGWQKGKEGIVYTLTPSKNPTTTPAIEGQRLDDIENWLKSDFEKLAKEIGFVTKKIDTVKIIAITAGAVSFIGGIASIVSLIMQLRQ